MKSFWQFLCQRRVILLGVIFLFSLLIWFCGPYVAFAGYIPLASNNARWLSICLLLLFWCLTELWLSTPKLHAKSEKVETQLGNKASTSKALPVVNELRTAKQIFIDHALTKTPHILVLGNRDAGKTQAIQQGFKAVDRVAIVHENEATPTWSHWHYFRQAVLLELDTEATHESNAWQEYLNYSKKHLPLQKILLVISLSELLSPNFVNSAQYYRKLIQQIYAAQQKQLPVYLLITHFDQLLGFQAYFNQLTQEQQQGALGFAIHLPIGQPLKNYLEETYSHWIDQFGSDLLGRLHSLEQSSQRIHGYAFIQQLAALKESLIGFLEVLLTHNLQKDPINLCGIYWSSALQQGEEKAPYYQQLVHTMGATWDNPFPMVATQSVYFLSGFFEQALSPIKKIPLAYQVQRRLQNGYRLAYLISSIAMISFSGVWLNSYLLNSAQLQTVGQQLNIYQRLEDSSRDPNVWLLQLNTLHRIVETIHETHQQWQAHWGLYSFKPIQASILEKYIAQLNRYYNWLLTNLLTAKLAIDNDAALYQTLEAYYYLQKRPIEQPIFLQNWFNANIATQILLTDDKAQQAKYLFRDFLRFGQTQLTVPPDLLQQARQRLLTIPLLQRAEFILDGQYRMQRHADLSLPLAIGPNFYNLFVLSAEPLTIPWRYTRLGLNYFYQTGLQQTMQALKHQLEILGQTPLTSAQQKTLQGQLEADYLQQYIQSWNHCLFNLHIKFFSDISEAEQAVNLLIQPHSVLDQLLELIQRNTQLNLNPLLQVASNTLNNAFGELNKLTVAGVNPYQTSRANLIALANLVNPIQEAPDPGKAAFTTAQQLYTAPTGNVLQLLLVQAKQLPQPVQDWLITITEQVWESILNQTSAYIDQQWQNEVIHIYQTTLANRYPLNQQGVLEAGLGDFSQFFMTGGYFDKFATTYLAPFVNLSQPGWPAYLLFGKRIAVPDNVLQHLSKVNDVRKAFFSNDGKQLSVSFTLKPYGLDRQAKGIQLNLLGQSLLYQHGPQQGTTLTWPNQATQVDITFTTLNGKQYHYHNEGNWAWLRLLAPQSILCDDQEMIISIALKGLQASYCLVPGAGVNPFNIEISSSFTLPEHLLITPWRFKNGDGKTYFSR